MDFINIFGAIVFFEVDKTIDLKDRVIGEEKVEPYNNNTSVELLHVVKTPKKSREVFEDRGEDFSPRSDAPSTKSPSEGTSDERNRRDKDLEIFRKRRCRKLKHIIYIIVVICSESFITENRLSHRES